jgi:hypothetical protein
MPSTKAVKFADDEEHFDLTHSVASVALSPYADPVELPTRSSSVHATSPAATIAHPALGPLNPYIPLSTAPSTSITHSLEDVVVIHELTRQQPVIFDVSTPLERQVLDNTLLSKAAINVPKMKLDVRCKGLPWKIEVAPAPGNVYVTVQDILSTVYNTLQLGVAKNEMPTSHEAAKSVKEAWLKRDPSARETVKRIDFLGGKTLFAGLEVSEDNFFRIHFKSPGIESKRLFISRLLKH